MAKYVAFLRGINSGKNQRVKMEVLRGAFENMGFEDIKTVIASGNVIFETASTDLKALERKIEKALPGAIGFVSDALVLRFDSILRLAKKNPFKGIRMTSQTRTYVTFIREESDIKFPVIGKGFKILGIYDRAVCSVVDLTRGRTPDFMRELDKRWKVNTTRGCKTIERILI